MRVIPTHCRAGCAALAAITLYATTAMGTVFNWDGSSGAQYGNQLNWTPQGVPGAADTAILRLGNVPVYPFWLFQGLFEPINATVSRMVVGTNTPAFAGGVLTVANTDIHETGRGLIIGEMATDLAIVNCGLQGLTTRYGTLGVSQGGSGTLNLTAGYFNVTGFGAIHDLIVGLNGSGAINVSGGADVGVTDDTTLGRNATGVGNVSVAGAGSVWTSSSDIIVGNLGVGNLSVTSQGLLSSPSISLAELAGSVGTVTVSGVGSSLTGPTSLVIGKAGNGTFDLTQGAQVNCTVGYIGQSATSTSTLNVSGPGSTWNSAEIHLGEQGSGTLNITDSGRVNTSDLSLARQVGSGSGSVYVSGLGATLINSDALDIGVFGDGVVEVSAGGRLDVISRTYVANYLGSTGQALVTGATTIWTSSGHIYVGFGGVGSLEVSSGATFQSDHSVFVGYQSGSHGTLVLSGPGSVLDLLTNCGPNCGGILVSQDGEGDLYIDNGARANSTSGLIGNGVTPNGAAFIDGAGSRWFMTQSLSIGSVGSGNGTGALTVTNQGTAEALDFSVRTNGAIHGDGNIVGAVANDGLVSPGTSVGTLHCDGSYEQTADGELRIELASASSYDQLQITGSAILGGTLSVELLGGFTPSAGQSFTILTASAVAATFAVESLPIVPGLLFDVEYNAQSVVLNVSSDVTAVDLPPSHAASYGLDGAVPNPFNPATTIGFRIASPQFVALDVYDLSGRLVKRLLAESLPAGEHSIIWNGHDGADRSVGSGVYLYRLRAGHFVATRRMVLVK